MIKKLFKPKPCERCKDAYHVTMTGEDKRKYIVPVKIRYCPFCGRRVS